MRSPGRGIPIRLFAVLEMTEKFFSAYSGGANKSSGNLNRYGVAYWNDKGTQYAFFFIYSMA